MDGINGARTELRMLRCHSCLTTLPPEYLHGPTRPITCYICLRQHLLGTTKCGGASPVGYTDTPLPWTVYQYITTSPINTSRCCLMSTLGDPIQSDAHDPRSQPTPAPGSWHVSRNCMLSSPSSRHHPSLRTLARRRGPMRQAFRRHRDANASLNNNKKPELSQAFHGR